MKRAWLSLGVLAPLLVAGLWLWSGARDAAPSVVERAGQLGGAEVDGLSARTISAEDLPPEGTRSLFDHLVAQNEGLPYPFEKLIDWLAQQSPDGVRPVTVFIPLGRSLLKAQADFQHPRVLVATDFEGLNTDGVLGLAPRGQLFLGFVENASEIEVISYNEAAGRFEFQLVQDYSETGERRIVYARRAVCLTCHQGAAPIFPQRPWNETNGQPEPAAAIVAARGSGAPYLGAPIRQPLAAPERFDELTDVANFLPVLQRAWLDGCGDGRAGEQCRRLLLKLALRYLDDPGSFDTQGVEARDLLAHQARAWPAEGIAVPESDLRNRDPLVERSGWKARLKAWITPAPAPDAGARNNEDLAAFDRLPKLPADQDPLTPRPPKRVLSARSLEAVYGLAAQFTADDRRWLAAQAADDWTRVLASVDRAASEAFQPSAFSRVRMLQALSAGLRESSSAAPPAYCCLLTTEMSPPVAISVPPLALSAGSALQPFADYCFACHRGNPSARLNFMAGADEAEVAQRIRETESIRDALDWERFRGTDQQSKLMPPADSPQHRHLEAALQQQPELLDQMRAQVPGLFDF